MASFLHCFNWAILVAVVGCLVFWNASEIDKGASPYSSSNGVCDQSACG